MPAAACVPRLSLPWWLIAAMALLAIWAAALTPVDAGNGKQIWVRQVDDHPYVRLAGAPALYENSLYVPVASLEKGIRAIPGTPVRVSRQRGCY